MAVALGRDVAGERVEVVGTQRLRPVPGLPVKTMRQKEALVHIVGASPFHASNQVGESGGRCDAKDSVDVIRGAACGEENGPRLAALVAKDGAERGVEGGGQQRPSPSSGPHDVDEHEGRRSAGHEVSSAGRRTSCSARTNAGHDGNRGAEVLVPAA